MSFARRFSYLAYEILNFLPYKYIAIDKLSFIDKFDRCIRKRHIKTFSIRTYRVYLADVHAVRCFSDSYNRIS